MIILGITTASTLLRSPRTEMVSYVLFAFLAGLASSITANPDAKRLYDDLIKNSGYSNLVRPVGNNSDTLTVYLGLKLGQLIQMVSDIFRTTVDFA